MSEAALWFAQALLPAGWAREVRVAIADGRIADVVTGARRQAADEVHAVGLPGLANLHSHAFQRALAGLAEARGPSADSFWTWRARMYRFVETIAPEDLEAIAAMAFVEMLESGFTRVGEFHYLHRDPKGGPYSEPAEMAERIAAAASESGIALTLLAVFYAHSGFGGLAPLPEQRRFLSDPDFFARLLDGSRRALAALADAVLGVAPHSLRAVTLQELSALVALAGDAPIHIHVAEQTKEVEDCLAFSGARPVDWLLDHAPVGERWCLVHATHMTETETRRLAAAKAVAGLCPITEANLGDGLFPAEAFLEAGGRFGVGSDSNVLIDAAEELRTLEYGQRLAKRRRNVLAATGGASTGSALYRGALAGGAQALGAACAIEAGAAADLVSLNAEHPALWGRTDEALVDSWIFAARGGAVDCVWRAGKKLVSGGLHLRREAIVARYRAALARLAGRGAFAAI
ncbi:MAG TPA: formimidoylglutamate deiminase [Rhizomicrobium sp.]|nr:formimidoylglutamate deiminase [Rhizomicrobium sp.]